MTQFAKMAGILGFVAVALGAFGAHGLEARLIESGHLDTWQTATLYLFVHMLALFALSFAEADKCLIVAGWSWIAGSLVFSGSLYLLSLTCLGILGAITPLGGLSFLVGWCSVIYFGFRRKE